MRHSDEAHGRSLSAAEGDEMERKIGRRERRPETSNTTSG